MGLRRVPVFRFPFSQWRASSFIPPGKLPSSQEPNAFADLVSKDDDGQPGPFLPRPRHRDSFQQHTHDNSETVDPSFGLFQLRRKLGGTERTAVTESRSSTSSASEGGISVSNVTPTSGNDTPFSDSVTRFRSPQKHERQRQQQLCLADQQPTTLCLTQALPSLLPSDFRRLAPQSRHLDGWTTQNSLSAVLQGRHPVTHEPLGHYTLLFDSRAAALAYLDSATRLHALARDAALSAVTSPSRRKPPTWWSNGTGSKEGEGQVMSWEEMQQQQQKQKSEGGLEIRYIGHRERVTPKPSMGPRSPGALRMRWGKGRRGDQDNMELCAAAAAAGPPMPRNPEEAKLIQAFTLAPPTAKLSMYVRDTLSGERSRSSILDPTPQELEAAANRNLEDSNRVFIRLEAGNATGARRGGENSGVSIATLIQLIERDGAERNLEWRLLRVGKWEEGEDDLVDGSGNAGLHTAPTTTSPVTPLQLRYSDEAAAVKRGLGVDITGELLRASLGRSASNNSNKATRPVLVGDSTPSAGAEHRPFFSFVVTFLDDVEARRFVREWHRRRIVLPQVTETYRVSVTALW